jgi:hypothetical protein
MVFNKQSKIAFVCPPRTGSTTLHTYLHGQGWFRLKEKHANLYELVVNYPNLKNYKVYGFLRDPLERFESCVLYAKQNYAFSSVLSQRIAEAGIQKTIEEMSYEDVVDNFSKLFGFGGYLFKPQVFWLNDPRVATLDFYNRKTELEKVIGLIVDEIPTLNASTDFGRSVITDKVREFVRDYYAADYALAKDRLGKEY